ncbi:hypothetical protein GGG16DRAFT_117262 [Schizophyllum commune]
MASQQAQYVVQFTGESVQAPTKCMGHKGACPAVLHDKNRHFLVSANGSEKGRWVCDECYRYYKNKPSTVRRPAPVMTSEHHGGPPPAAPAAQPRAHINAQPQVHAYPQPQAPTQPQAYAQPQAYSQPRMLDQQPPAFPYDFRAAAIHKGSAAAQRGDYGAPPVRALSNGMQVVGLGAGSSYDMPPAPSGVQAIRTGGGSAVQHNAAGHPLYNLKRSNAGLIGMPPPGGAASGALRMPPPLIAGYGPQHLDYAADRQAALRKRYSSDGGHVANVQSQYYYIGFGKAKKVPIRDIWRVISNVPVRIGAADLKALCIKELQPSFANHFPGVSISPSDIRLCSKNWIDIVPPENGEPDIDAIAHEFIKTNKKTGLPEYRPGTTNVNLVLSQAQYEALIYQTETPIPMGAHITELDDASSAVSGMNGPAAIMPPEHSDLKPVPEVELPVIGKADLATQGTEQRAGSKRARAGTMASQSARDHVASKAAAESQSPPATPPAKRSKTSSAGTSANRLISALQLQKPLALEDLKVLFVSKDVRTYLVYHPEPAMIDSISSDAASMPEQPDDLPPIFAILNPVEQAVNISLPMTKAKQLLPTGTFKRALYGVSERPLFANKDERLCAKEAIFRRSVKGEEQTVAYPSGDQLEHLVPEIMTARFSRALHEYANVFINSVVRDKKALGEEPPFSIPWMRFVECALAIESKMGGENKKLGRVLLLEELIPNVNPSTGAGFRKFIGNGSCEPLEQETEEDKHRAMYLSACQHIQYIKTRKAAFVADYQGGDTLLTDAQILTHPDLGETLFALGNVKEGFEDFEKSHVCNSLCGWLGLEADFDSIVKFSIDANEVPPLPEDDDKEFPAVVGLDSQGEH